MKPVKSLFVPDATAANVRAPDETSIRGLRVHKQQVGSFFIMRLPNPEKDYWHATSSHPTSSNSSRERICRQ